MSGVSGGSLGLAVYSAHVVDGVSGSDGTNAWVDEVLGDDYLAAPVGWLFFADLPRTLLGFGSGIENRTDVMERAWEAAWPTPGTGLQRGVVEVWRDHPEVPPAIYNGTSVNDACRFNASPLDVDGATPGVPTCAGRGLAGTSTGEFAATHDLVDFLCPGDDVRLSTAAGLGARYPVVSVSGRVKSDQDASCAGRTDATVFVVDGAYLEGSGSGSLLDAWHALAPSVESYNASSSDYCVVPFMLHIDNGYESRSISGSEAVPREFLVPLAATLSTASGITGARAEAALAFGAPFTIGGEPVTLTDADTGEDIDRYLRLVTLAHPGVQAPLGWTLSQASIDDLRDQLSISSNARAIEDVRAWLETDISCGA